MEDDHTKRILEGVLLVSTEPVTWRRLKTILPDLGEPGLRALIEQLNAHYLEGRHAFRIQEVAGGYQLVTDAEFAPWIKRFLQPPREGTVSPAALETLAIVAYRQPITKAEIEAVRGVDGSATLETLVERQFVRITGRKETAGRPLLYGTTAQFLKHFGLKGLEALPPMEEQTGMIPGLHSPDEPPQGTEPSPAEVPQPAEGTA